jgi:DNA-binding Xre family transcriptional regulator
MDEAQKLSKAVAAQVRVVIAARGIRKKELATPLGITPDQVYRKTSGRVPFSVDELDILASALDVAPWEFIPGAPPRHSRAA